MTNDDKNPKQICLSCKGKIVDFFIFKKRTEEARKIYKDSQYKSLILDATEPEVNTHETIAEDKNSDDDDDISISGLINTNQIYLNFNNPINNEDSQDNEKFPEMSQLLFIKTPMTSPEEEEEDQTSVKLHPENWERTRRKIAKNMGKSYRAASGKMVEAKRMKTDCGMKCRMQCNTRMAEETRLKNFNDFYSLADIEMQRKFIQDHIQVFEPKHTKQKVGENAKTRSIQRLFFLDGEKEGEMAQVCKTMFLNTLVISSQTLDTVQLKASVQGSMVDLRGRYPRRKA